MDSNEIGNDQWHNQSCWTVHLHYLFHHHDRRRKKGQGVKKVRHGPLKIYPIWFELLGWTREEGGCRVLGFGFWIVFGKEWGDLL